MELKKYKLKVCDEEFQNQTIDTLNKIQKIFSLKSSLTQARRKQFWETFKSTTIRYEEAPDLTLYVTATASPFTWRDKANFKYSSVINLQIDLASDQEEELFEVCEKLALTANNVKISVRYGWRAIYSRYSNNIKPLKKVMNIEDILPMPE